MVHDTIDSASVFLNHLDFIQLCQPINVHVPLTLAQRAGLTLFRITNNFRRTTSIRRHVRGRRVLVARNICRVE